MSPSPFPLPAPTSEPTLVKPPALCTYLLICWDKFQYVKLLSERLCTCKLAVKQPLQKDYQICILPSNALEGFCDPNLTNVLCLKSDCPVS